MPGATPSPTRRRATACACGSSPAAGAISSTARPRSTRTFASVDRQVGDRRRARRLAAAAVLRPARATRTIRGAAARPACAQPRRGCPTGIRRCTFVFENHDGASLHPEVCREILDRAGRPNIRMNFDPINFAKAGVDPVAALARRSAGRRPRAPEGARPRRVLRVRRGRRRPAALLESLLSGGYAGQLHRRVRGRSMARCACTAASTGRSGKSGGY